MKTMQLEPYFWEESRIRCLGVRSLIARGHGYQNVDIIWYMHFEQWKLSCLIEITGLWSRCNIIHSISPFHSCVLCMNNDYFRNPFKLKLVWIQFKNSVRTSKRTSHFTITKINWLTLFKEIIIVYTKNNTKCINTKCRLTYWWRCWYIYLPSDFKRLKNLYQLIFVMERCFLWGAGWILKYYLDERRLQRVKVKWRVFSLFLSTYNSLFPSFSYKQSVKNRRTCRYYSFSTIHMMFKVSFFY
jgi:hypothetical protein